MPTYTVPTARTTGYLVTATNWNDELVGNMLYFKDAPVFDTAAIIGAATTNGIRLDIESGTLAVREGDDSGYGPLNVGAVTASGLITAAGVTSSVALLPSANDAAALGASGTAWADLFLASGGVVNFNAGDVTITHSADALTFAGAASGYAFNDGPVIVTAGTVSAAALATSGDTNTGVYFPAADTVAVTTGGVSRMVIGSSGNVSLGYATPPSVNLSWLNAGLTRRFADTATGAELYLSKTRGTEASPTAVASADGMGTIWFQAYGGTNHRSLAFIQSLVTTYTSDTDMTSHIRFATTNAGTTATERLRITGAGDICIASGAKLFLDSVFGGDTYLTETAANQIAIFTGGSERLRLDGSGNVGVNVTTFGTSAAGVLGLKNGTEPSSGPADTVQLYSVDRSAGNTIPAVYCEGSGVTNAGITSTTVTHKIALKVNGTVYYLLATTNAT